ncbi:hypothetical protein GF323_05560 [Candidatus Woesearchaeota archaeon]|nr:hypothetical protein [Candidatus Woesearchaeota archaeon]
MLREILFVLIIGVFVAGCAQQSGDTSLQEAESLPGSETQDGNSLITAEEFSEHDNEGDCWIVYEGKVYDISGSADHPNMMETFWKHCGKTSGFEQGAKSRHSGSSQSRLERFGDYVGDIE